MCARSRARGRIHSSTLMLSRKRSLMLESPTVICRPLAVCGTGKRERCHRSIRFGEFAAFRNYADYAATEAFRKGLDELRRLARDNCCAIMCAEAVWWRCHRRIIADYLLAEGVTVSHIMGHNKIEPAKLTPGVRLLPGGTLVYPAAEEEAVKV